MLNQTSWECGLNVLIHKSKRKCFNIRKLRKYNTRKRKRMNLSSRYGDENPDVQILKDLIRSAKIDAAPIQEGAKNKTKKKTKENPKNKNRYKYFCFKYHLYQNHPFPVLLVVRPFHLIVFHYQM